MKKKLLSIVLMLSIILSVMPMLVFNVGAAATGTCPDCGSSVTWQDNSGEHMVFCDFCSAWKVHIDGQDSAHCTIGNCANSGGSGGQQQEQAPTCEQCGGTGTWETFEEYLHRCVCSNENCSRFGYEISMHDCYSPKNYCPLCNPTPKCPTCEMK